MYMSLNVLILFTDETNHIGDGEDKTGDQQNGILYFLFT